MRKAFHWIWGGLAGFCLMLVCLITAVDVVSYHMPGFYERTYESLRIPEEADISMENLLTVTQEMMEYLRGRRESLADIRTTIRGEEQFFFNAREVAHMEDVRGLFLSGLFLRRLLLLVIFISLVLIKATKGRVGTIAPRALLAGAGLFFLLSGALFFLIWSNFERYFILFHEIFFDNDLWLLDPRTDFLINIVPLPFFIETAKTIGLLYLGMLGLIFGISGYLVYRSRTGSRTLPPG